MSSTRDALTKKPGRHSGLLAALGLAPAPVALYLNLCHTSSCLPSVNEVIKCSYSLLQSGCTLLASSKQRSRQGHNPPVADPDASLIKQPQSCLLKSILIGHFQISTSYATLRWSFLASFLINGGVSIKMSSKFLKAHFI